MPGGAGAVFPIIADGAEITMKIGKKGRACFTRTGVLV